MKHKIIPSLLTAGALALAASASLSAKEHDDAFAAMDANGDGKVTQAEHLAFAQSLFKQSDANNDMGVTATEWDAAALSRSTEKMDPKETEAQLRIMDSNGDGKVSYTESDAFARSIFAKADKNGDRVLTQSEFKEANKKFKEEKKQPAR